MANMDAIEEKIRRNLASKISSSTIKRDFSDDARRLNKYNSSAFGYNTARDKFLREFAPPPTE